MSKTFKEKREILNSIPKDTHYCYTPTSKPGIMDSGKWGYTIDSCKFYKHEDGLFGSCKLYNCEVIDQVKSCGLNE